MKWLKDWVANPYSLTLKDTILGFLITTPLTCYFISSYFSNKNNYWILIIFIVLITEILITHLCVISKSFSSVSNFYDLLKNKVFSLSELPNFEEYIVSKKILNDINTFLPKKFRSSLIDFYKQFGITYKPIKIYLYNPIPYKDKNNRNKIDFIVPTAYSVGYEPGASVIILPYSEEDLIDPLTKFKLYHEIAHVLPINQKHDSAVWLHGITSAISCFLIVIFFSKNIWSVVTILILVVKDLLYFQRGIFDLVNESRADYYSYSQLSDTELISVSEDLIQQWKIDIDSSSDSRDIIQKINRLANLEKYIKTDSKLRSEIKPRYTRPFPYLTVFGMIVLGFFNNKTPSLLIMLLFIGYLILVGVLVDIVFRAIQKSQFVLENIIEEKRSK